MARYAIEDTTLTAIGDAIRNKTGKYTRIELLPTYEPFVSKTPNAITFDNMDGGYGDNRQLIDVVRFQGATKIKVNLAYQTEGTKFDYLCVAAGEYDASTIPTDVKYGDRTLTQTELIFENTDVITFYFRSDSSASGYLGYYAECVGYDENDNIVPFLKETEVPATLTPLAMADEISGIPKGVPEETFEISGNCEYRFAHNGWSWFINMFGDKITTKDISESNHMFYYAKDLNSIPFEINFKDGGCHITHMFCSYSDYLKEIPSIDFKQNSTYKECSNLFNSCYGLEKIETIKNLYPDKMNSFFSGCYRLRELPKFENLNLSRIQTSGYANMSSMFTNCRSLRSIPEDFLKQIYGIWTSYTNSFIYSAFMGCYVLDEIRGLNPQTGALTNNMFRSAFSSCHRLKDVIFAIQDDGTPYSVNWKSQTIDLSECIGYVDYKSRIFEHNSGITEDKEVKDDATYQALKDNPDWFTADINYARYNHDSAVNTINSLPIITATGTTNTIKFRGASGALTDGGAINTLTEEEIAVAAAKGWTVSLV